MNTSTRNPVSVLVVDDDVDNAANLTDILQDAEYVVDAAHSGYEALQLMAQYRYDVALLDFKMPGMDGATLLSRMKEIQPEVVAIMVTAYTSEEGRARAQNAGSWRVLQKPVDIAQILAELNHAMQQPAVLVVDDDVEFCRTMWDVLRDRELRVGLAHDAQRAEELLGCRTYDLVLLDMRLGDDRGERVFEYICGLELPPQTVLITAYRGEMDQSVQRLVRLGALAVHYKPLAADFFQRQLAKLLET